MPAETVSFRLTKLALAKGLVALRNLEPNYRPESIHKLVQMVYYDYCAKMAIGHRSDIPIEIFNEIDRLLPGNKKKTAAVGDQAILNKLSFLKETQKKEFSWKNPKPAVWINKSADNNDDLDTLCDDVETESKSSSVKDFSFLKELGGNDD